MGEVYRARDTRLDRSVAVKILPDDLAAHAVLRARFEREAKAISGLSHPHICALFDIGENYIVMELLEGETLAQRLNKGPLTTEQLLRIGVEIADALDKAHRSGIVHRDLKPGNVMLTKSGAKLLDFGLAKTADSTIGLPSPDSVTKALTEEGTIVGTYHYMAPEQLEGRPADPRSDLFALGALLYEMATGRRAFDGTSRASVIAAVLHADPPPITQIRPMVPPALDRVVRTCLEKDPDDRWQTAHDVMLQLRWILEGGSSAGVPAVAMPRRVARERIAWSLAAIGIVAAIAALVVPRKPQAQSPVRFTIETPRKTSLFPFDTKGMAISPDGSTIAFVASGDDGKQMLYVRRLASERAEALAGTDDAAYPFWSPDSRSIAFFANRHLNRIRVEGGPVEVICDAPSGRGGSWSRNGTIVFAPSLFNELQRVPATGGTPARAANFEPQDSRRHRWPWFLPDGNHFLHVAGIDVVVTALDSMKRKLLVHDASNAVFSPPDRIVFSRGNALMSQRFDPTTLEVSGDAAPLPLPNVSYLFSKRLSILSVSDDGTLVFLPAVEPLSRLAWVDRDGRETGQTGQPDTFSDAALSPDGTKIAVVRSAPAGSDIWLIDARDGRAARFTLHSGDYGYVTWSHDSKRLAFTYAIDGVGQLSVKSLDGSERIPVMHTKEWAIPVDFSPDGKTALAFFQTASSADIVAMSLDDKPTLTPYLATPFDEQSARFSPDGKWVAYDSNVSLRSEVYVRRYPPTAEEWQISSGGGMSPVWSPDGRELFYTAGDAIMRVPIGGGPALAPGTPAVLFKIPGHRAAPSFSGSVSRPAISGISPDGQRFLFRLNTEQEMPSLNVVLNWRGVLREP